MFMDYDIIFFLDSKITIAEDKKREKSLRIIYDASIEGKFIFYEKIIL